MEKFLEIFDLFVVLIEGLCNFVFHVALVLPFDPNYSGNVDLNCPVDWSHRVKVP